MTSNKIDSLTLMTGAQIFLKDLNITLLQPKLSEIGIVGEVNFYKALSYFLIEKKKLSLDIDISDFDLFMYIINNDSEVQKLVSEIFILTIQDLSDIKFFDGILILKSAGHDCIIDEPKFLIIKEAYEQIFCLQPGKAFSDINPANDSARKIAEKLERRRQKLAAGKSQNTDIFTNLISILTIGSKTLSIGECLNLTVYQIYNLIKRFNLYEEHNMQLQALLQGAKDIELTEWTKQL